MPKMDELLAPLSREFTLDDLTFSSESEILGDSDDWYRQPIVRLRGDERSHEPICILPRPFSYPSMDAGESLRHLSYADEKTSPPKVVTTVLRAIEAGYRLGVSAGRKQVLSLSRLLAGGYPDEGEAILGEAVLAGPSGDEKLLTEIRDLLLRQEKRSAA